VVHTADIQDRDGAPLGWPKIIRRFPWLRHVFADGGYAGAKLKDALRQIGKWTIEIVKRSDAARASSFSRAAGLSSAPCSSTGTDVSPRIRTDHRIATAWLFIASIRSSRAASQDHEISPDNFESDGVVAALPRRHRNVPGKWCLQPQSGKDGNRDEGYDDRGGPGKECFSAARGVDDRAATVQQEVVPGEVPKLHGRAAARSGCDGGLWQCALLGARDGQAWP
jgi:putative transposase